jgi:hypothetical protein
MDNTYEITHSWGDPREPEYHDGLPVSYAIYRDRKVFLYFKIIPIKQHVGWVEGRNPAYSCRQMLGLRKAPTQPTGSRGPKKPKPKLSYDPKHPHESTHKLLTGKKKPANSIS